MEAEVTTRPDEIEEDEDSVVFQCDNGIPQYVFGHFDTSLDNFPYIFEMGRFKTGWVLIGEEEDGPLIAMVKLDHGVQDDHAHFHNSAQIRIFIEGSAQIGTKWYKKGDIRIQQAGKYYGPEKVGPDGVVQLLFFADRRGMYPHYHRARRGGENDGIFQVLMGLSGVKPI